MFTFHRETNKQDCKRCEPYRHKTGFIMAFFAFDISYSLRSIHTFIDSLIHPPIHPSIHYIRSVILRQTHGQFERELSTEYDLVLPPAIYRILSFP